MAITLTFSIFLWVFFIIKANKKLFFRILPTCYVAALLDVGTDLLVAYYPIWSYPDKSLSQIMIRHSIMAFGVYFVTTYFFLQWFSEHI